MAAFPNWFFESLQNSKPSFIGIEHENAVRAYIIKLFHHELDWISWRLQTVPVSREAEGSLQRGEAGNLYSMHYTTRNLFYTLHKMGVRPRWRSE